MDLSMCVDCSALLREAISEDLSTGFSGHLKLQDSATCPSGSEKEIFEIEAFAVFPGYAILSRKHQASVTIAYKFRHSLEME